MRRHLAVTAACPVLGIFILTLYRSMAGPQLVDEATFCARVSRVGRLVVSGGGAVTELPFILKCFVVPRQVETKRLLMVAVPPLFMC